MYNPVNVAVQPSSILKKALYGLLVCTVAITLYHTSHAPIYSVPILLVSFWYATKLYRNDFPFLKHRHWRWFNDELELHQEGRHFKILTFLVEYVRPTFVVLKYKMNGRWHWDILLQRDCEYENFRQLKAVLKIKQRSTPNSK